MAITTVVAPLHTVKLAPKLKAKIVAECRIYAELSSQRKVIDQEMAKARNEIDELRDQTGEKSLEVDGYKISLVEGVSSKLDRKKLLAAGVSESQLEAGTLVTPKKAFVKITAPGEREEA